MNLIEKQKYKSKLSIFVIIFIITNILCILNIHNILFFLDNIILMFLLNNIIYALYIVYFLNMLYLPSLIIKSKNYSNLITDERKQFEDSLYVFKFVICLLSGIIISLLIASYYTNNIKYNYTIVEYDKNTNYHVSSFNFDKILQNKGKDDFCHMKINDNFYYIIQGQNIVVENKKYTCKNSVKQHVEVNGFNGKIIRNYYNESLYD